MVSQYRRLLLLLLLLLCYTYYYYIMQAMMEWGRTIRKWYGRVQDRQLDVSNNYIGYYTDNGKNCSCPPILLLFVFSPCSLHLL